MSSSAERGAFRHPRRGHLYGILHRRGQVPRRLAGLAYPVQGCHGKASISEPIRRAAPVALLPKSVLTGMQGMRIRKWPGLALPFCFGLPMRSGASVRGKGSPAARDQPDFQIFPGNRRSKGGCTGCRVDPPSTARLRFGSREEVVAE
jgi:hypothetical protein